jgi:tetratricopeptide (TPR) repeat protein
MHAPSVEYADGDQFAMSLYASQTNDLPRLTEQAHADLRRTVAAMIGYPESDDRDDVLAFWPGLPSDADGANAVLDRRAQLLRAALGMVRSVYSLSTIAKLAPATNGGLPPAEQAPPYHPGLVEDHRLLIRWMLRQAVEIDRHPLRSVTEGAIRPFYAEEIVWLYNECAVLSYMQGRLPNAIALFERAEEAARIIEPFGEGALRTRIALNRALADIDRGRVILAERALAGIRGIRDEHPVIRCVATGMLGVVDHLRGRYQSAERHYAESLGIEPVTTSDIMPLGTRGTDGLIAQDRSRAASIVARHYGDLLRTLGNFGGSSQILQQSATLAIEGGHEDVHHFARLSTIRLELARNDRTDFRRLHQELDVVEGYGRVMGMPRLQCEVDLARTRLHQKGGDLKGAASVASRGLTVATANDLRLRKTTFLLQLATIAELQGRISECRPLLQEAFDIARDTDYHSARAQAGDIWARIMPTQSSDDSSS